MEELLLYGVIGEDLTAASFGYALGLAAGQGETVEVRMNCYGGSVMEGNAMYADLLNARQKGAKVNVTVTGIAASMGAFLLSAFDSVRAYEFSRIMIHAAYGQGEEVSRLNDSLAEFLAKKMKKTAQEVKSTYMQPRSSPTDTSQDHWLTGAEAYALGIVDELLPTTIAAEVPPQASAEVYYKLFSATLKKETTMLDLKKLVALWAAQYSVPSLIGKEEANIEAIVAEIVASKEAAAQKAVQTATAELQTRLQRVNAELLEVKKDKAEAVLSSYIKAGVIAAEEKGVWQHALNADYEATVAVLEKRSPKNGVAAGAAAVTAAVTAAFSAAAAPNTEGRENWSYKDWSVKDAKGLSQMEKNDPERYKALTAKYTEKP